MSPALRRWLWRGIALLLALNLFLAMLVIVDRGELPPLVNRPETIEIGTTVRVVSDQLNLRAAPGEDAQVVDVIRFGTRLTVIGPEEIAGGEYWWPVAVDAGGETTSGYVWAEGVEPAGTGMLGSIQKGVDGVRRSVGEAIGWTP